MRSRLDEPNRVTNMADSGKPPDLGPCESKFKETAAKDDSAGCTDSANSTSSHKEKQLHEAGEKPANVHQDIDTQNVQKKPDRGKEHECRGNSSVSSKDEKSSQGVYPDLDPKGAGPSTKETASSLNKNDESSTDGRSSPGNESSVDPHPRQSEVVADKSKTHDLQHEVTAPGHGQEKSSVGLASVEEHATSNVGMDHSVDVHQHTTEESPNGMKMQPAAGMEVSKETTSENVESKKNVPAAGPSESMENKASVSLFDAIHIRH